MGSVSTVREGGAAIPEVRADRGVSTATVLIGRGLRAFGLTPEFASASKSLAANQGLYNGFLAAGLVWALATDMDRAPFFLVCVAVAGIYGSYSVNRRIFYVQSIPALVALVALHIR